MIFQNFLCTEKNIKEFTNKIQTKSNFNLSPHLLYMF